ncbi:formate--tetrahydrofolate ligase [Paucilactobacillus wasatchensis]|uniref:Formate--tetrahydrofolate ligase n=1 Tax=Paucilactobacillus wasatchensis TaxID=1335616 RepID=A0A0D1A8L2_9LACO|nr:formate--tetrahydrofolate ligase [Paucilactobacillus wasatchensis]KIS04022.1 Formate--tetrahydrofolate ligase [Paucilactobacillus wasatchensis]
MTDLEIAQAAKLEPISKIASLIGLSDDDIEPYGKYKAKINPIDFNEAIPASHKLVLVTSINPTPAGEGKSTVLVGLGDALTQLNHKTIIAMREPSMGPVMGMKGGATGGGYSQVVPMEDINLHFTGDMHALTSANNTLAALIDNYLLHDNQLDIDPRRIIWKRVLDINDRALRQIVTGMGGVSQGVVRQTGFEITAASELMAILCLATDLSDLKRRISNIVIGYNTDKQPVTVGQLHFEDAITILLKEALKPNLVQTLGHTPTIIHGGPFANIAHGCNSVLATKTALNLADYTVTEAGFGADLGAEKFLDIKRPILGKTPDTVVVVATVRALKYNGGQPLEQLENENLVALENGFANLQRHLDNMNRYQIPVVVSINHFTSDTKAELDLLKSYCERQGIEAVVTDSWANGGSGTIALAHQVVTATQQPNKFTPLYNSEESLTDKLTTIVTDVYGGSEVTLSKKAQRQLQQFADFGWQGLPVCIAKTQYSFSDDPHLLGAPTDFTIHIREFIPKIGAGFIVALAGNILTMPGLPKKPAALNMHIDADGKVTGLF